MTRTKPKKKPRWTQLSSTRAPDPRVSEKSKDYGKRLVLVTTLIDDQGRLWERVARDPPVLLGHPPEEGNADGG